MTIFTTLKDISYTSQFKIKQPKYPTKTESYTSSIINIQKCLLNTQ